MKIKILIFCLFFSLNSYAVPSINIDVYRGVAPIMSAYADTKYMWKYAVNKIRRELGVRVKGRGWKQIKHPNYNVNLVDVSLNLLLNMPWAGDQVRPSMLLAAPPLLNGFGYFFGVTTDVGCKYIKYTQSVAVVGKTNLINPYAYSITAIAHELGHVLGATHTGDNSIMYYDALKLLPLNNWELYFSDQSRDEVKQCISRMK